MNEVQDIYPSRQGSEEAFLERQDPVVHGNGTYGESPPLSRDQLLAFGRDGFIILEDYLPEYVEPLANEFAELSMKLVDTPEYVTEPESEHLRSIFRPHMFGEVADRLSRDPRMIDIARQILGSEVYLHQARINVKPALEGRSFPWHSDFETWHVEDGIPRMRILTGWIMLTENNACNGPLFVIPGSHHHYLSCSGKTPDQNYLRSLQQQVAGTPSLHALRRLTSTTELKGIFGKPGTVVFHEGNIMHGSPDNISTLPRTNLFFVYNSVLNTPGAPFGDLERRPEYLANRICIPIEPLPTRKATE